MYNGTFSDQSADYNGSLLVTRYGDSSGFYITQILFPLVGNDAPYYRTLYEWDENGNTFVNANAWTPIITKNILGPLVWYGTCSTAAGTTAKAASLTGTTNLFTLAQGTIVVIRFSASNTAATPTLNVKSTGAKTIRHNGVAITGSLLTAGDHTFQWDGTYWNWLNAKDLPFIPPAVTNNGNRVLGLNSSATTLEWKDLPASIMICQIHDS